MAFHIRNPETDALARKVAEAKGVGLTEAVHQALKNELEREERKPDFLEISHAFARRLKAMGNSEKGLPIDKDFIDSLYE